MKRWFGLVPLIGGHALPEEDDGPARRTQIVLQAMLASGVLAAIYGFSLAGNDLAHGAGNLGRMPLVVLLATVFALPAGLLAWNIAGRLGRASDLVLALASGNLTASLVLGVLAPLVALYGYTTDWIGPVLALLVAGVAVVVGVLTMLRAAWVRRVKGAGILRTLIPVGVVMTIHLLTLTQLVAITELMPETTFLDAGVEGLAQP